MTISPNPLLKKYFKSSKKIIILFTLTLFLVNCPKKEEEADPILGLVFNLAANSRNNPNLIITRDFRFAYTNIRNTTDNQNMPFSSSGNDRSIAIITNKNFTFSTDSIDSFPTATYTISPALAAPATFSTTTGTISGIYTSQTTPSSIQYTITGTLPPTTPNVNNLTFSARVTLITDTETNINNATCQFFGAANGCSASIAYSCNNATQCSTSTSCSNISGCPYRR
ncbi:MAG: hypothetical protein MH321_08130 [Leptospiraceae bacterium]|nr:hypothetical protein [Leptospiraceae bacterium]